MDPVREDLPVVGEREPRGARSVGRDARHERQHERGSEEEGEEPHTRKEEKDDREGTGQAPHGRASSAWTRSGIVTATRVPSAKRPAAIPDRRTRSRVPGIAT